MCSLPLKPEEKNLAMECLANGMIFIPTHFIYAKMRCQVLFISWGGSAIVNPCQIWQFGTVKDASVNHKRRGCSHCVGWTVVTVHKLNYITYKTLDTCSRSSCATVIRNWIRWWVGGRTSHYSLQTCLLISSRLLFFLCVFFFTSHMVGTKTQVQRQKRQFKVMGST